MLVVLILSDELGQVGRLFLRAHLDDGVLNHLAGCGRHVLWGCFLLVKRKFVLVVFRPSDYGNPHAKGVKF